MSALKTYAEALFSLNEAEREAFLASPNRWRVTVDGQEFPPGVDFSITSPFGEFRSGVVVDKEGRPLFDRPNLFERPSVDLVVYGFDKKDGLRIAMIRQERPHADDPTDRWVEGHSPVTFGQVPMGFIDTRPSGEFESPQAAAIREVGEETGARVVVEITRPKTPWHIANPAIVGSWVNVLFVQVELDAIEALKEDPNRHEKIITAEYVTVPELLRRIREGVDESWAYYRSAVANSVLMIFFATHPELFKA